MATAKKKSAAPKPKPKAAPTAKAKVAPKKAAPKKAVPKKAAPKKAAAQTAAPKKPAAPVKPVAMAVKKSTPVKKVVAAPPAAPAAPAVPAVDHAARVGALWQRLEAWVAAAGAPALELNPGATEKAIAAAEKTMKLAFPADFRASLRLHDGQASNADGASRSFPWLPGCPPLAPLAKIVEEWKNQQGLAADMPPPDGVEPGGRLKAGVYHTGRIPIAGTPWWDGDNTFLDLDPGPTGTIGQVITMVTECDFVVVDTSFAAALERWINVLERGLWLYDPARHAVHPKALLPHSGHAAGWFSKR